MKRNQSNSQGLRQAESSLDQGKNLQDHLCRDGNCSQLATHDDHYKQLNLNSNNKHDFQMSRRSTSVLKGSLKEDPLFKKSKCNLNLKYKQ